MFVLIRYDSLIHSIAQIFNDSIAYKSDFTSSLLIETNLITSSHKTHFDAIPPVRRSFRCRQAHRHVHRRRHDDTPCRDDDDSSPATAAPGRRGDCAAAADVPVGRPTLPFPYRYRWVADAGVQPTASNAGEMVGGGDYDSWGVDCRWPTSPTK